MSATPDNRFMAIDATPPEYHRVWVWLDEGSKKPFVARYSSENRATPRWVWFKRNRAIYANVRSGDYWKPLK